MNFIEFWQDNKNAILAFSIFLNIILVSLSIYLFISLKNQKCPECVCEQNKAIAMNTAKNEEKDEEENKCIEEEKKFYVEIKGEVNFPGVYEATKDSLINDIVEEAGGLTKKAYTNNINMSRKVSDELVIYIYSKDEMKEKLALNPELEPNEPCLCPTYDISGCTEENKSEIVAEHEEETYTKETWENEDTKDIFEEDSDLVNINTASKETLMSLDYIGEAKAKAIIEYREANGSFKSIEEIKNVKGIGNALFEKIKNHLTI